MYHNGFVNKSLKESNLHIRGTTECQIKKTQSAGDGNYNEREKSCLYCWRQLITCLSRRIHSGAVLHAFSQNLTQTLDSSFSRQLLFKLSYMYLCKILRTRQTGFPGCQLVVCFEF